MTEEEAIKYYKNKKVKVFTWMGYYYYNYIKCEKIKEIIEGNLIERVNDYPFGFYEVFDNGFIKGTTMGGFINLKYK
jgi:hypothetical protein